MGSLYSHIVFQPPEPPHYEDKDGKLCLQLNNTKNDPDEDAERNELELPIVYIRNLRGHIITGAFFSYDGAQQTILFSHVSCTELYFTKYL